MNNEILREDVREHILALKLMQSERIESPALSTEIMDFSLENKLYHLIADSFCWKADIPFIICIEHSKKPKIKKIKAGKKRGRGYCLSDDEKFRTAIDVVRKTEDGGEYTERLGREIFGEAMGEIARRLPSRGSSYINASLSSEICLRIWELTHSSQQGFAELVKKSWNESGKQLIEIAITIDTTQYRRQDGDMVGLYDLPSDVAKAYYHGFSEFHELNSGIINETSIAIDEVQKLSSEFPSDFLESYISDTIAHLEHQNRVVNDFDSRIRKGSSKNIRVYDTSLDGFLNYPLPPM